jgi:hypothetical protein
MKSPKQLSLAETGFTARRGKTTRKEAFLSQMESVVPWSALQALIEPHYYTWACAYWAKLQNDRRGYAETPRFLADLNYPWHKYPRTNRYTCFPQQGVACFEIVYVLSENFTYQTN